MDVKALYTLAAVADHGSFAEAGKALGLSVSGVSVQIRALEQDVGLVLFDRSRRPPVLTPRGREFLDRARELIARWEDLSESLKRSASRGVLRLGAVHTSVSGILPAALLALRESAPDLEVHLSTGLTHELEPAVRAGRIDAAVTSEPDALTPDLRFYGFAEERLMVIAAESAAGVTWREVLESNHYIRFARQARVAGMIEAHLLQLGIAVRSRMEIDTLDGVIELVRSGLGVSIVPERKGGRPFPKGIKALAFGDPVATRRLGLLVAEGCSRRHFVETLLRELCRLAG